MVIELLTLIPNWVIYVTAGVSLSLVILSHMISFLPSVKYSYLLKPFAYTILLISMWLSGFAAFKEYSSSKIQELEIRLEIAKEQSSIVNTQIEYIVQEKVKTVKDVQVVVQEKIKEVEVYIDSKCEVDPLVNKLHNASATNNTVEVK